jgi:hypothetical protein
MDGSLSQPRKDTCSEIVNRSARLSPFEDFRLRSLDRLQGLWRRVLYLASLRSATGEYDHWGMRRTYGKELANGVLGQAHSSVYIQLLRTPLSELMRDAESCADETGNSFDKILQLTNHDKNKLIPSQLMGGAPRHFSSVVLAACALRSAQRASTRLSA